MVTGVLLNSDHQRWQKATILKSSFWAKVVLGKPHVFYVMSKTNSMTNMWQHFRYIFPTYFKVKSCLKSLEQFQASFLSKKLNIRGKRVNLSIWDTAGQERFHALGPIYYRDANGAVLVYDITDADSFTKVKTWIKELRKMLGNDISLAIAGNKIDLEKQRHVDHHVAEE